MASNRVVMKTNKQNQNTSHLYRNRKKANLSHQIITTISFAGCKLEEISKKSLYIEFLDNSYTPNMLLSTDITVAKELLLVRVNTQVI